MDRISLIKARSIGLILISLMIGLGSALLGNVILAKAAGRLVTSTSQLLEAHSPLSVLTTTVTAPALLPDSPQATATDHFGYTMVTDVLAPGVFDAEWKELAGDPTATAFTLTADSYKVINLGFTFPFYENKYLTSIYIDENGLLSFLSETRRPVNDPIPRDILPNNYIAAFWDNLDVGNENGGRIFYKPIIVNTVHYMVIEWWNVTRVGAPVDQTLTFQIWLTEIGDVYIYYKTMNNDGALASSGIEDPDGVDGIQVAYRQPNFLVSLRRTVFSRPAANAFRVKVLPHYRGKFVVGNSATFPLIIRNTSDTRNDTYNLLASPPSGWGVSFIDPATRSPVGMPLGVNAGTQKLVNVVVKPLANLSAGAYTAFTVTVRSTGYSSAPPYLETYSKIQAAIPPSFSLAFYQSPNFTAIQDQYAMVDWVWVRSNYLDVLQNPFTGRNLAFVRKPDKGYVYAWDRPNNPSETKKYREVDFLILSKVGGIARGATPVFDQASSVDPQEDTNPSVAATLNGMIGFAWKRAPAGAGGAYIENIFFAVRNADGSVPPAAPVPIQVTTSVAGERVDSPTVAATTGNQFILVWVRQPPVLEPNKELWYAVFDSSGTRLSSNALIAGVAGFNYSYPSMTRLADGKVMLNYSRQEVATSQFTIQYRVCSLDCQSTIEHTLSNAHGSSPQAVQFANSTVLLAWTNSLMDTISYAWIPQVNSPVANLVPVDLSMPTYRSPDYVSIAIDSQEHALLVWMDVVNLNYVFFTMIDSNGVVITPPMSIMGEANGLALNLSATGQSIALYDGSYRTYTPYIRK